MPQKTYCSFYFNFLLFLNGKNYLLVRFRYGDFGWQAFQKVHVLCISLKVIVNASKTITKPVLQFFISFKWQKISIGTISLR